jgi:CBS domain-containing protein
VVPAPVDPTGKLGPTRGQAAGPNWRKTSAGHYVPAATPVDVPEQRILEASLRLPPQGAVTGWAACRLHGANLHDGLERNGTTQIPVPLAVGTRGGIRRDSRISVDFERLTSNDWMLVQGVRTMKPVRATFDAMRRTDDVREAVVALDMMAAAKLVSIKQVAGYAETRTGARRIGVVRAALPLASEHSRSPNETRTRLVAVVDAGLPRDLLVNCAILDRHGRLLGIADLLDTEAGLVIEFDGADHRGVARHSRDVIKEDDLRGCELEVVRVTGPQLLDIPVLVRRLRTARGRARFVPEPARKWVARPRANDLDQLLRERAALGEVYQAWRDQGLPGI